MTNFPLPIASFSWLQALVLCLVLFLGCTSTPPAASSSPHGQEVGSVDVGFFKDVAAETGLVFQHDHGGRGHFFFTEIVGSGVAVFDYDQDGDQDVFLVQNAPLLGDPMPNNRGSRLFRNNLIDGDGNPGVLSFTDVTEASGIQSTGNGMGAFAGDLNNDGWPDLYVTRYGPNQLFLNQGDGTFRDVTAASGTGDPGFSVSATLFDGDGDGLLDLFVANYVEFQPHLIIECKQDSGRRDYCGPKAYTPAPDRLYRNLGEMVFEDVTARSQVASLHGPGLGVVAGDWNGDGLLDLYVANDGAANFYWVNQGDLRFENQALLAGNATNINGLPEASMGLVSADFDNDGDEDLFMTHLTNESNTFYTHQGNGWFRDESAAKGLTRPSRGFTGFGTAALDVDRDGWLDLVIANGAVSLLGIEPAKVGSSSFPYDQPNQVLRNVGNGAFEDISVQAGPAIRTSLVSRGLAMGDLDNDGASDVVINHAGGPTQLLLNRHPNTHPWLGLHLRLNAPLRDALGAKVRLGFADGTALWRTVRVHESYASSQDPRLLMGLGTRAPLALLEVHWPDGTCETFPVPELNRYHPLIQGTGQSCSPE